MIRNERCLFHVLKCLFDCWGYAFQNWRDLLKLYRLIMGASNFGKVTVLHFNQK